MSQHVYMYMFGRSSPTPQEFLSPSPFSSYPRSSPLSSCPPKLPSSFTRIITAQLQLSLLDDHHHLSSTLSSFLDTTIALLAVTLLAAFTIFFILRLSAHHLICSPLPLIVTVRGFTIISIFPSCVSCCG